MSDTPPRATGPPPRVAKPRTETGSTQPPKPPPAAKGKPKPRTTRPRTGSIGDKIANQVTLAGMMIGTADPVAGFILVTNAENFGESWAEVAAVNPRVRQVLENWFSASVYADAGMATVAIVLPLATHYLPGLRSAWFNPAGPAISQMEALHADGATLADMLKAHAEAQAQMAAMRAMFDGAMNGNGDGETVDADATPDHFEVS